MFQTVTDLMDQVVVAAFGIDGIGRVREFRRTFHAPQTAVREKGLDSAEPKISAAADR